MAKDPTTIAQKWATNLASSTQAITDGVNSVQVAPGQAAARQANVWVNNVVASKDKWAKNVGSVSLQDWQSSMTTKGIPRIASGAQAAQGNFGQFMAKLLPFQEQLVRTLPARGNLDQNIARLTAFVRGMAGFSNS